MRLRLSVAPFPGEPANSIIGRIAARNGACFAQDFCADMNASWRATSNGDRSALADMAELAGLSVDELCHYAARDAGHHVYELNGHCLTLKTLDRYDLKVCPSCLLEDFRNAGELGRHCRVEWLLSAYQVCHVHRTPMLALPNAEYPRCPHDFYQRIRDCWRKIRCAAEIEEGLSSNVAWETYLASRVRGLETGAWCDRFDLDLLCHITINLGTVMQFGASRNPTDLRPNEKPHVAASAFLSMKHGLKSLARAFRAVRDASTSPKPGFQADFGAFARWLYRADYSDPNLPNSWISLQTLLLKTTHTVLAMCFSAEHAARGKSTALRRPANSTV